MTFWIVIWNFWSFSSTLMNIFPWVSGVYVIIIMNYINDIKATFQPASPQIPNFPPSSPLKTLRTMSMGTKPGSILMNHFTSSRRDICCFLAFHGGTLRQYSWRSFHVLIAGRTFTHQWLWICVMFASMVKKWFTSDKGRGASGLKLLRWLKKASAKVWSFS